jgi:hypothetical protein
MDVAEPPSLPWGFYGPAMVVRPYPGERIGWTETVQNGQSGESGAGAADATAAGDLDAVTELYASMGFAQRVQGVVAVGGDPEVRPVDASVWPGWNRAIGQDQCEVGGTGRIAYGPTPNSGSAGQHGQSDLVQPGVWSHRSITHG